MRRRIIDELRKQHGATSSQGTLSPPLVEGRRVAAVNIPFPNRLSVDVLQRQRDLDQLTVRLTTLPGTSPLHLLSQPSVREELALNDEQAQAVADLSEGRRELFHSKNKSSDEWRQKLDEFAVMGTPSRTHRNRIPPAASPAFQALHSALFALFLVCSPR